MIHQFTIHKFTHLGHSWLVEFKKKDKERVAKVTCYNNIGIPMWEWDYSNLKSSSVTKSRAERMVRSCYEQMREMNGNNNNGDRNTGI